MIAKRLHIVIFAFGTRGDISPLLAIGCKLHEIGHRVRFVTLRRWCKIVEDEGLEFVDVVNFKPYQFVKSSETFCNCQDDPMLDTEDGWHPAERAQQVFEKAGTLEGAKIMFDVHQPLVEFLLRSVKQICGPFSETKERVDVVLLSGAALILSDYLELHCIPIVFVTAQPVHRTHAYASPLLSLPYSSKPSIFNLLTWNIQELITACMFRAPLEAHRRELGIRADFRPGNLISYPFDIIRIVGDLRRRFRNVLTITTMSDVMLPIPNDLTNVCSKWFIQQGPIIFESRKAFEPPSELCNWLQAGSKPIYFGYGSLQSRGKSNTQRGSLSKEEEHMLIWLRVIRTLNQQHGSKKFRAILSFSWNETSKELSDGRMSKKEIVYCKLDSDPWDEARLALEDAIEEGLVYVLKGSVPHTWLFPNCMLAVHHGGCGTSQTACISGIPSIVIPHISDQFFMGTLLQSLGVSPEPVIYASFSETALLNAISEIVLQKKGSADLITNAQTLQKQMIMNGNDAKGNVQKVVNAITSYVNTWEAVARDIN
ncbi:hypothetical protein HK098_003994 [Nowakowskiella sp. JEL0407]|nr:hypothetical protein HK098_003994 [Nowakowskiella sp. JEL0407]